MFRLFQKRERLIGIDIGSAAVKIVELAGGAGSVEVVRAECVPLAVEVFSNNSITKPDRVITEIGRYFAEGTPPRRVVTAVPAPGVFVKKISVPRAAGAELAANVQLEASSLIPHKLDAVKLDFQVLGRNRENFLEVLLVAVKRDVLESFTGCLNGAGLETAVVDVDIFALQNAFEFVHPDRCEKTVALVNVGARYTGVNICRAGRTLFSGDIALGGRGCTEAIGQHLGVGFEDAEARKIRCSTEGTPDELRQPIDRWVDGAALEVNRQVGLLWNAAAVDGRIDALMVSGGGGCVPGFLEALGARTELPCERFDPFQGLGHRGIDAAVLARHGASMGVALGLALRAVGDKSTAEVGA